MRSTRRLKWLAFAVAMVLVPAAAMPLVQAASADATLTETEVVASQLSESGAVSRVAIDDFLRLQGSGTMRVTKKADLRDVSASFDSPKPSVSGSTLTWNEDVKGPGKPTDIYFTGQADLLSSSGEVKTPRGNKQLPVRIKTTYSLNGTEVTDLEKIRGKAGTFELELTIDNITGQAQQVTYTDSVSDKEVTDVGFVFVPLTVSVGPLFFDDENWKGVEAENGQLGHKGDGSTVAASGVLFPPTQPGSMTLKVKAQTKSFNLPSARVVVTPGIGMEQAKAVADAQELGGGATDVLLYALNQFYGAFLQLTDPEEGLPKAANGLKQIAEEGLDVLSRSLEEGGRAVNTQLVPNMKTLYDGLLELRTQIEGQLAPGLSQMSQVAGKTNWMSPLCAPAGQAFGVGANCTFANSAGVPKQLAEVPPMAASAGARPITDSCAATKPSYATTTGTAASLDTRNNAYRTEEVTRSVPGQLGGDLTQSTMSDGNGGFFGSLYNWAAMTKFSMEAPVDANSDGCADFPPFVFPNPSSNPGYYTTAALESIVKVKGELWPGVSGGPATPQLQSLCIALAGFGSACPVTVPSSDITVRDLLTPSPSDPTKTLAQAKIGTVPVPLLGGTLDLGDVLLSNSNFGIANAIDNPAKMTVTTGLGPIVDHQLDNRGYLGAFPGEFPALLALFLAAKGVSGTAPAPPCWPTLNQVVAALAPGNSVACHQALAGPLGAVEVSATVIETLLFNPGFNFTASIAGYPGYQTTDIGNAQTGPKIAQILNLIAYSLDRADALCPSSMPKDGSGNYIVPVVPPVLDTPCNKVLPDPGSRTVKPQTAEKALSVIAGGYGNPRVTRLDRRGQPDDIATAVRALGKALQFTAPAAIGTFDAADVGVTIEGSIAAVYDGLSSAVTQLGPAVSGSPLLIGGVSGVQISGDFNTALSQAGLKRAKKYTTFMGLAESGGEEADGSVMFVFELPGVKV